MNKARRKQLESITAILTTALDVLGELRDAEEDAYDNLPESIQESDRGYEMQEITDNLSDAYDSLEEAIDSLGDI